MKWDTHALAGMEPPKRQRARGGRARRKRQAHRHRQPLQPTSLVLVIWASRTHLRIYQALPPTLTVLPKPPPFQQPPQCQSLLPMHPRLRPMLPPQSFTTISIQLGYVATFAVAIAKDPLNSAIISCETTDLPVVHLSFVAEMDVVLLKPQGPWSVISGTSMRMNYMSALVAGQAERKSIANILGSFSVSAFPIMCASADIQSTISTTRALTSTRPISRTVAQRKRAGRPRTPSKNKSCRPGRILRLTGLMRISRRSVRCMCPVRISIRRRPVCSSIPS